MSTQKGNVHRSRPQKYKNTTKYVNDKYDSSKKTQAINSMKLEGLCSKCESIIQWKIKYKKYKPLTVPTKCIKCQQKNVKSAYHNICKNCAEELDVCSKCGEHYEKEKNEWRRPEEPREETTNEVAENQDE